MPYQTTTNHDEIRTWIEEHGGHPAVVKGTTTPDAFGALRIDFRGDENLERISWTAFFDRLEANELAFSYNDEFEGPPEDKFKLVDRNDAASRPEDHTTLPDVGDQEAARENMYASAPEERQDPADEQGDDEREEKQSVW